MSDENQTNQENAAAGAQGQAPQFNIQRIYTKDISFEQGDAGMVADGGANRKG